MIREIRQFQQTPYAFELSRRVVDFLLDTRNVLEEEELYNRSLEVEPRSNRLSSSFGHSAAVAAAAAAAASAAEADVDE